MKISQSLEDELVALQSDVRREAANPKLRVHLFQLLCVMGRWSRALSQLQVCGQMDAMALPMAQTYREAIRCELFRQEVFAGKRSPQVMGKPPVWIGPLIEALRFDASGDAAAAAALRAQSMDEAEPRPCVVDGVSCEWLADGDSRLGSVCEVVANGQYYWLPFESCQGIYLDVPTDLRDLVWAPGEVVLPNEGRVAVLIPTRYPGTEAASSDVADDLKRSKRTEWIEPHPGTWFGTGQRLWTTDLGEHAILDTRSISMNAPETQPGAVTAS